MKKKEVVIVIPIYKQSLDINESISLDRIFGVLGDYDIVFIAPEGVGFDYSRNRKIIYLNRNHFTGIAAYNDMLLDARFYTLFEDYEFVLLCQLDVFVFKNDLSYFCNLGYDYIGAPWLFGRFYPIHKDSKVAYVGNGGLSLRKVKAFYNLALKECESANNLDLNEDLFFSLYNGKGIKVAPVDVAVSFSFETEVRKCYELNHYLLPFGCHAWWRYDIGFMGKRIEDLGYDVEYRETFGDEDAVNKSMYKCLENESRFWGTKYKSEILHHLLYDYKRVFIFGAGYWGRLFGRLFAQAEIVFDCFIDNNKKGLTVDGRQVISIDELAPYKIFNNGIIVVATKNSVQEIEGQLQSYRFRRKIHYILIEDLFSAIESA